ncbi:PHP domain-containing protein [Nanoarchaeota archaeon]
MGPIRLKQPLAEELDRDFALAFDEMQEKSHTAEWEEAFRAIVGQDNLPGGAIDLHMHSTYSDGVLDPKRIVVLWRWLEGSFMGLTDHDSFLGVDYLVREAEESPLLQRLLRQVVGGAEITTDYQGERLELIALGYHPSNPENAVLRDMLIQSRHNRENAILRDVQGINKSLTQILDKHGRPTYEPITRMMVLEQAQKDSETVENPYVSRRHVALAIVAANPKITVDYVFDNFIRNQERTPWDAPKIEDAAAAAKAAGLLVGIAHCKKYEDVPLEEIVHLTQTHNLDFAGAYHPKHTPEEVQEIRAAAESLGISVSGGSDMHGTMPGRMKLGVVSNGQRENGYMMFDDKMVYPLYAQLVPKALVRPPMYSRFLGAVTDFQHRIGGSLQPFLGQPTAHPP